MNKKIIICPKCGQENDLLFIDCCKCGIVFSKYYGILARDETDEEKKAELLRKQQEEEEKAEALRKQQEEEKELQKRVDDIKNVLKPKTKLKDLLKKYEGQTIGINYDSSTEIKDANFIKVGSLNAPAKKEIPTGSPKI